MALIKCEECGHEMSDKALACPNCGNPNKYSKKTRITKAEKVINIKILLVSITLVLAVGIIISVVVINKNKKTILEKIVYSDYQILKEEKGNNIRIKDALFFKRTSNSGENKGKIWYQVLIVYKQNESIKYAGFDDEGRYMGDGSQSVDSYNDLGTARDNLLVQVMKVEYEQYSKGMNQVMYGTNEYEEIVEEKDMGKYEQCVVPVSLEKIK